MVKFRVLKRKDWNFEIFFTINLKENAQLFNLHKESWKKVSRFERKIETLKYLVFESARK